MEEVATGLAAAQSSSRRQEVARGQEVAQSSSTPCLTTTFAREAAPGNVM